MRNLTVSIRTTEALREFIVSKYGSDTIKINKEDVFTSNILSLLRVPPKNIDYKKKYISEINLIIPQRFFVGKVYRDGLFRFYLSENDQEIIIEYWNHLFKEILHNYILAFCKGYGFKTYGQKMAIYSFCEDYDIPMNKILYDTLKKSWDRSSQKKNNAKYFKKMKKIYV